MHSISLNNGEKFYCEPDETLLSSAIRSQVTIGYSCRTGRCGSCKCKVIRGKSFPIYDEVGLTEQEKASNWILSCVRTAASDMTLEVENMGDVSLPQSRTVPCRIQCLERLADDVMRVVLRLPPAVEFYFLPGQYVDVIGQGGVRRSYSLASASSTDKCIELHIRAIPNGVMSSYWFGRAKVNDLLRLYGPLGTFFLRNVSGLDLIFLATGTGIAPVKSILEGIDLSRIENKPRSVTVYWGARESSDLYWDVTSVPGTHRYVPVLSQAGREWSGARGYVQQALMAEKSDFTESVVYACGSNTMIHCAKQALLKAGLRAERFLSDAFVCSASI